MMLLQQVSGENLCRVCQKRVYAMEKVIADEVIYHKTCFKCNHCKRVLRYGTCPKCRLMIAVFYGDTQPLKMNFDKKSFNAADVLECQGLEQHNMVVCLCL